ncbi:winged helix-turn-helix transcriptional regulator [Candidatus Bathyarchaeota archaeon]|nr:winged helix-turn-helix transcriptional regulator [Candidatus Bathyarchaeota archaeon]
MSYIAQSEFPNYEELSKRKWKYTKPILGLLLRSGKAFSHSELVKILNIPQKRKSTLWYNLDVLEKLGFIARERVETREKWVKRGPIKLKFKTPLCFIANTLGVPYAYLGLLGLKDKLEVSETETAVKILENIGLKFERIVVVTTQKAVGVWSNAIDPRLKIEWHTLSEAEFNRIERVEERVRPIVVELMREYILIMDCTSGPRPAGIAYYRLASQFKVPLIYVYLPDKTLLWLISKEMLEKELKHLYS